MPHVFYRTKTRIFAHKTLTMVSLLLLCGGGWYVTRNTTVVPSYYTTTVTNGSIETSIKGNGTAELIHEQQLRFNQVGTIAKVYVTEGMQVKKGQLLAELDTTDVQNKITQATLSLENARLKLNQQQNSNVEMQIKQAQNTLAATENSFASKQKIYDLLKQERIDTISKAEKSLAIQQQEYEQLTSGLALAQQEFAVYQQQQKTNLSTTTTQTSQQRDNAMTDTRKYSNDAEQLLEQTDLIFGITDKNRQANDSFETYLSAKNTSAKNQVERYFFQSQQALTELQRQYNILVGTPTSKSQETAVAMLTQAKVLYESIISMASSAVDATQASVSSSNFSDSTIQSYVSKFVSIRSQAQASFDSVKNAILAAQTKTDIGLETASSQTAIAQKAQVLTDKKIALDKAKIALEATKNDLERLKKDYENKLTTSYNELAQLQETIIVNKLNLGSAQDGTSIVSARNDVLNQELNLASAKKNLDNYRLVAAFDGVTRKIDFQVGDNLVNDAAKYIYLENPNLMQITVYLDQIDIVKVSKGQNVRVVFDAFPTTTISGTISKIDSTPVEKSSVVSYAVTVALDKGTLAVYQGMTAKLTIITTQKENILTIPSRYITANKGRKNILLPNGTGGVIERDIETGISDSVSTEIISGLVVGETIAKEIVKTSTSTSKSLFPAPGGGSTRQSGGGGGSSNFRRME